MNYILQLLFKSGYYSENIFESSSLRLLFESVHYWRGYGIWFFWNSCIEYIKVFSNFFFALRRLFVKTGIYLVDSPLKKVSIVCLLSVFGAQIRVRTFIGMGPYGICIMYLGTIHKLHRQLGGVSQNHFLPIFHHIFIIFIPTRGVEKFKNLAYVVYGWSLTVTIFHFNGN